jgi:hypothetical protein
MLLLLIVFPVVLNTRHLVAKDEWMAQNLAEEEANRGAGSGADARNEGMWST